MKILKVGLGFTTNSSSSHSIIWVAQTPSQVEHLRRTGQTAYPDNDVLDGTFGWQFFTAASVEAKRNYLGIMIRETIRNLRRHEYKDLEWKDAEDKWGRVLEAEVIPAIKGMLPGIDSNVIREGYIDHDSLDLLPTNYSETCIHTQFIKELWEYMQDPRMIIIGGNDNDEDCHYLTGTGKRIGLHLPDEYSRSCVARKDGEVWTIFDKTKGKKVRFTFDDTLTEVKGGSVPEICDISITHRCPYGCNFCYMDATPDGVHADFDHIKEMADYLGKELQVFEVALGGGEPTLHPQFVDILKVFCENKIVPSFTTRNPDVFDFDEEVMRLIGAFGFSVSNVDEALTVMEKAEEKGLDEKLTLHVVMGTMAKKEVESILQLARDNSISVLLLDYKTTGRGASFKPINYDWLPEVFKTLSSLPSKFGIDTPLAARFDTDLKRLGVPKWRYSTVEGDYNVYLDAVDHTAGASSYGAPLTRYEKVSDIVDIFRSRSRS